MRDRRKCSDIRIPATDIANSTAAVFPHVCSRPRLRSGGSGTPGLLTGVAGGRVRAEGIGKGILVGLNVQRGTSVDPYPMR